MSSAGNSLDPQVMEAVKGKFESSHRDRSRQTFRILWEFLDSAKHPAIAFRIKASMTMPDGNDSSTGATSHYYLLRTSICIRTARIPDSCHNSRRRKRDEK
jgi:hypothetical protein